MVGGLQQRAPTRPLLEIDDFALDLLVDDVRGRTGAHLGEPAAHVGIVETSRQEIARLGLVRHTGFASVVAQPTEKVVGLVSPHTHTARGHIDQMIGTQRAVGDSLAGQQAAVDQDAIRSGSERMPLRGRRRAETISGESAGAPPARGRFLQAGRW